MVLNRRIKIQLIIAVVVALIAGSVMVFGYIQAPALLFGIGRYKVTVELADTGGLYESANVTYRGTEVGRVSDVRLTDTGIEAVLSLRSGIDIPSDTRADVHSQTAIGEQFVELLPRGGTSPPLKNGDVIPRSDTSVPPDINNLLNDVNTGLQAIPRDNLNTMINEADTAIGGLGPDLARFVKGSTALAVDARQNLDPLTALIDNAQPVLDAQAQTSDSIQAWADHLATITDQFKRRDAEVAGILKNAGPAVGEVRQLFDRLQPTLPIILANLASLAQVGVVYRADLEQLLVLLPQNIAVTQGMLVPNANTKQAYKGAFVSFSINLNLPPPCTTGFIPAQQQRTPAEVDYPDRPEGDLYCRVPQDSPMNVRGARNIPCETVPGKRAPTVAICESNEPYVPLNDGLNWKGDPNATLSGQAVPQLAPGTAQPGPVTPSAGVPPQAPPPLAVAGYDPATGTYVGPDGRVVTQSDLAQGRGPQTWQSMLVPPGGS